MDMEREKGGGFPRILLINLHSSLNAGDDALTREAMRQLSDEFPQATFTLAMNDPVSYQGEGKAVASFTTWVKAIEGGASSRWRWEALPGLVGQSLSALVGYRLTGRPWFFRISPEHQALLEAYFQADLVLSSAGNFLYTSGRVGLPFLLSILSIAYAWFVGKPLYTLPQTLGPLQRKWEHLLAKKVLSKARLVLVRDPISAEVWRTWDIRGPQWALFPDLAFAFRAEAGRDEAVTLLKEHGIESNHSRPLLGVTLINWGAQSRWFSRQALYEDSVAAVIRAFLVSYGGHAVLFAQVHGPTLAEDDRVPARRVLARLGDLANRVVLIERRVPPHVLKGAYGQMDLFLGTRLHSNIFALTEGVPVIAIGYQYKTRGVMRMLGLERWTLDIEQVNEETLIRLLHEAWAERKCTRARIEETLTEVGEQASQAGALIASDFLLLASRAEGG